MGVAEPMGLVTQIELEPVACFRCGEIVSLRRPESDTSASVALDGRPVGPVGQQVQRCSFCNYCAPGLTGPRGLEHQEVEEFVQGEIYQNQLGNPHLPELANTNLCWALLCRQARDFEQAGRAALRAAWLCDDARLEEAASWCRERALEMLLQVPSTPELQMLQVDLLRRAGRFEGARTHCQKLLKTRLTPGQTRLVRRQLELIGARSQEAGTLAPGPRKRF